MFFFDKNKNRKLKNIKPSLNFLWYDNFVKKTLCRGMAWLLFQKERKMSVASENKTERAKFVFGETFENFIQPNTRAA